MIALEYQIIIALLLDQLFGDPRWLPHPVCLIGRLCGILETAGRALFPPFLAGLVTTLLVLACTGLTSWAILAGAAFLHPMLGSISAILLLYTCFAARSLVEHSRRVYLSLAEENLPQARQRVGMMVGRDTAGLDHAGVTRATVESVAENLVDGITAPLFFAVLGGPVAAILYKAVNTMDSTFGYKNERYLAFGWAAARLDDLANLLPARLTALVLPLAALLLGLRPVHAAKTILRDRFKHASPNSGHSEAAVAGALGIQLGGPSPYFGTIIDKPFIGEAIRLIEAKDILRANRLIQLAACLCLLLFLGLRKWLGL